MRTGRRGTGSKPISSLMDTWIVLANDDVGGRHRRGLYVLKSRGMSHSNEVCEFALTDHGLDMLDAPGGPRGRADDVVYRREGRDRHGTV